MAAVLKEWKVEVIRASPRHPQTNGKVEQVNGTIKKKINAYLSDNKKKTWVEALPMVASEPDPPGC